MKIRYLSFLLLLVMFIPFGFASVSDIQVTPAMPEQGDLIHLAVIADPFETVDVNIELVRELAVTSGNYILRVNDIEIPQTPNEFSVRVNDVLTLNVAALGITLSPDVSNNVGYLSVPNLIPGKRDVKISGYAKTGESVVTCKINAWTQVTMDENGEFYDTYDLGDISPGAVSAVVGGVTKTVTIYTIDNTPPSISGMQPNGEISTETPLISASYSDFFGIKTSSVNLKLDGNDVTSQASITSNGLTYSPSPLGNNTRHRVQLIVSDNKGNSGSKQWNFNIKLDPLPDVTSPSISSTKPSGVIKSTSTQILASLSDNRRVDPSTVSVKLNQNDITGSAQITQSSLVCSVSNLKNNTLYTVAVSASDKSGNTNTEQWSFTVQLNPISNPGPPSVTPNIPPEPHIQGPGFLILGDILRLDGSHSIDSDGIITQYIWDLGDGTTKTGPIISYEYLTSGEKTVQLSVTDNRGSAISTSKTITVYSVEDYIINSYPGSSRTVFTGQRVNFDGGKSTSMGGKIINYRWNIGDSVVLSGKAVIHIFNTPGTYNTALIVTDQRGVSNSKTIQIHVISPPMSPSKREETIINNTTLKVLNPEIKTNITLTSTGETSVLLLEYSQNPFPSKPLPSNSFGKVKDVSVSNPDLIEWPIIIEMKVNSTLDPSYSSRLGIYWFNGTNWILCENTGYSLASNSVWAYMTKEETSGSPIISAIQPSPADIIVSNIISTSNEITIGESVDLIVYLENRGDLSGVFEDEIITPGFAIPFSVEVMGHNTYLYTQTYVPIVSGNQTISLGSSQVSLDVKPLPSDLFVVDFFVVDDILYPDEPFSVNLTLGNAGDSIAKNVLVHLLVGDIVLGQQIIPKIVPNEEFALSFSLSLAEEQEYNVTCVVDPQNIELEQNETNNEDNITVTITKKPVDYNTLFIGLFILSMIVLYYLKSKKYF